ncbi:hypothetical protein SteCoe_5159 [Stentor coeruleus]|uniref:Translin-associated factor X-interacting protein 1 N-terminal domain-containing protein n=1 Tax=Stentor coeruleus TaxID=5963 RepID=A0A1R2CT23_9CILI|nr:hypothetical protein SteCoe_5159 [Stentor coeruleus]
MKKSKSPDIFLNKLKPRIKNSAYSHISFPSFPAQVQATNLNSSLQKKRISSIGKNQSSKALKKKKSEFFKSSFNKSPSSHLIITHTRDDLSDISQSSYRLRRDSFIKVDELCKKIEKIQSNELDDLKINIEEKQKREKFHIAEELFDEIITKDNEFGKYLKVVKKCYEEHLQEKIEKVIFEKEIEKEELMMNLNVIEQENEDLQRSLEKISKENLELSKDIDICEGHCIKLQQKLSKVYDVSLDNVPNDPETWKNLVLENQFYSDLCKSLKKELEGYRQGKGSTAKIM